MRGGELQSWVSTTAITMAAPAAGVATFRNPGATPIRIVRWGWIANLDLDTLAGAAPFVGTIGRTRHNKDGSTATNQDFGSHAELHVDLVKGAVIFVSVGGKTGGIANIDGTGEVIVKPGDFLIFNVTTALNAGTGFPFVMYQLLNLDETTLRREFEEEDGTPESRLKVYDATVLGGI